MAWSTPLTAVANAALTAAQWNASVRDNLLETAPAKATTAARYFATTGANAIAERVPSNQTVVTNETTVATNYAALTTAGPAVTVSTSVSALVSIGAFVSNDTIGANTFCSYAISGATTQAAGDTFAMGQAPSSAGRINAASRVVLQTGLTVGSNVLTMQYRVSGGTGSFSNRHMAVLPF